MNIEAVFGVPPVNYLSGREGNPISLFVDHWIGAGTADQAVTYFQTPRPANPTSAHFIVGTTGRIKQMLNIWDTAYAAGNYLTNLLSINIEHEVTPGLPATPALYAASGWLHRTLADELGLDLIVGTTVRPHNKVVPTACPGTLSLERIVEEAMSYVKQEVFEAYQRDVAATFDALKAVQAEQAHHTHGATATTAPAISIVVTEPRESRDPGD